jgi:simple sugar transport system ATP-binding protein
MRNIVKRFPGVLANDDVTLTVGHGEIHALLGENGAGKSTLMQILYGFYQRDAGDILIEGRPVQIESPKQAITLGIGMVHQEFMLVHPMTVVENTVLGVDQSIRRGFDLKRVASALQALSDRHGLAINPHAVVGHMPVGVQQRVEIMKLLYRDARLLILDEPTAVLTPQEKDGLFAVLRGLAREGRSVVIVTHKLHEIMEVSDRVTVLRDGCMAASVCTARSSPRELARLMVGRDVALRAGKQAVTRGPAMLRVEDLVACDAAGETKLHGLSLDLHAGEILGIAGVDGNGQPQLAQALLNLCPIKAGRVLIGSQDVTRLSPAEHRAKGMAYVPADRRHVGSVAELSVADNAILGTQAHRTQAGGLIRDEDANRGFAKVLVERFGVRTPDLDLPAGKLSGGNLQKLVLGREMIREPGILIVEQPTRGLDVGAVETVWGELLKARASGMAVLLISADFEEILNLADRIAVMFEGRIVGILPTAKASAETLGLMMAGAPVPDAQPMTIPELSA